MNSQKYKRNVNCYHVKTYALAAERAGILIIREMLAGKIWMGEVGMAWRVVYRLAGTKKYPRARRQKNDEGKSEDVEGYGTGRKERKRKERRGNPGRTGTALAESRERGVGTRGSGTRDWGPPGFEERRNIESTTQRGEPSRSIKSRSELYCTLSHTDFPPALTI